LLHAQRSNKSNNQGLINACVSGFQRVQCRRCTSSFQESLMISLFYWIIVLLLYLTLNDLVRIDYWNGLNIRHCTKDNENSMQFKKMEMILKSRGSTHKGIITDSLVHLWFPWYRTSFVITVSTSLKIAEKKLSLFSIRIEIEMKLLRGKLIIRLWLLKIHCFRPFCTCGR